MFFGLNRKRKLYTQDFSCFKPKRKLRNQFLKFKSANTKSETKNWK